MLRAVVLLLLLANLVFYAWAQGWLRGIVGPDPLGTREPHRLREQVRPELIRILPAGTVAAPPAVPAPASAAAPSAAEAASSADGPALR